MDYVLRGQLKNALSVLNQTVGFPKVVAHLQWMDCNVFVFPRKVFFDIKGPDGDLSRSIRCKTARGERVALARSDFIAPGRRLKYEIHVLESKKVKDSFFVINKCLNYGQYVGLGAWRGSGGYGRFALISFQRLEKPKWGPTGRIKT